MINNSVLPNLSYLTNARLVDIVISLDEIISFIRDLNKGKATGPDEISAQMLIMCDDAIETPLKIIYENILLSGIYPDIWKSANLTPIHKKGDKQLVNNYRPICGKILEKVVFNQLYTFFISNNLITTNQSCFCSGDSTTNQLLPLVDKILASFDSRNFLEVMSVFLDISKAFDKVWHEGLIFKLNKMVSQAMSSIFLINYLSGRRQRVVINGTSSKYFQVELGVPQGSVRGPLLFLIYINDLENGIKSKVKFFAQ